MKFKLIIPFICACISVASRAQFTIPEEASGFQLKLSASMNQRHREWTNAAQKDLHSGKLLPADVETQAGLYLGHANNNQGAIEALAMTVLMQAAKDASNDLKLLMDDIRSANEKKAKLRAAVKMLRQRKNEFSSKSRDYLLTIREYDSLKTVLKNSLMLLVPANRLPGNIGIEAKEPLKPVNVPDALRNLPVSGPEVDQLLEQYTNHLDTLNEAGESQMLRMQLYMDRYNEMTILITNLYKKLASTQNTVIENLK